MRETITYAQAEYLLKNYNFLRSKVKNLGIELKNIIRNKIQEPRNERIEALSLTCREFGDQIQSNKISDLTAFVALNYETLTKVCYWRAERQVIDEIHVLGNLVEKIETALGSLKPRECEIVKYRFFEQRSWKQVEKRIHYGIRRCQEIKRDALRRVMALVDLDDNEKLMIVQIEKERGE